MKATFQIKVNSVVLTWARESLAISKTKAAEEIGITANRLDHLEAGRRFPSIEELKLMSKIYKRTIATLLLSKPPEEKPLPKDCRTVNSTQLGKFHDRTILAVRKARALAKSLVELRKEMDVPQKEFKVNASLSDEPSVVAKTCRKYLKLDDLKDLANPKIAFESYVERIESYGIAIFQLSLTQDNLRGFSITDEIIPIIVLKRGGELPTTKTFTLFHELGHIILKDGGMCDISLAFNIPRIEQWCNAFAAELLVPSPDLLQNKIVKDYGMRNEKAWIKKDLEQIGKEFHVGALVILRRLLSHGLTTKNFYSEKHITWNRSAFGHSLHPEGRNIPKEAISERGRSYISLAFRAYDQNKIDIKDLSDFIGVGLSHLPKTRQLLST